MGQFPPDRAPGQAPAAVAAGTRRLLASCRPRPKFGGIVPAPSPSAVARKHNVLGVLVDATNYDEATARILEAAHASRPFTVSALAVHGVMTGVDDPEHRHRLNAFDLIVPDGQPVRWMLNAAHGTGLRDRVYGPFLTMRVCEAAARAGLPIYLFGSTTAVQERLRQSLRERFPGIVIAGGQPSRFRTASAEEIASDVAAIRASGARLTLCGLGCPRQEVWAYEMRERLGMPILAVGAAFDFLAGNLSMAPAWMQARGLEWLYRLLVEPRRLWRRYLILNPRYAWRCARQLLGKAYPVKAPAPGEPKRFG
ncbi:MAG: WecB/TagA/CpsF family glycosyltransferase [Verrucomicrobia bacterium]|nr:WecB/TagA/CpsF family glycosyltransferase [Verrucomicrobiota bacterium]